MIVTVTTAFSIAIASAAAVLIVVAVFYSFSEECVRSKAVSWLAGLTNDDFCDYLPQLVQVHKFQLRSSFQ